LTGAPFLTLSIVLGVAASALAWSHARRVERALGPDLEALALSLKRTPAPDRLRTLLQRAEPGSFEHTLATEALAEDNADARIAATNALLSEIDHELARGARWPATGLRIALFGAALSAFLAFIAEPTALRVPLAATAVGGVAMLACAQAGRSAESARARQRRAVDALIAAAFSLPPDGSGALAEPPRRRRVARGGGSG
jgi:hypothetical protein